MFAKRLTDLPGKGHICTPREASVLRTNYPHPGYPLSPKLLRPVLSTPLPDWCADISKDFRTLADLSESIWAYLNSNDIKNLSDVVVGQAVATRGGIFWKDTSFPLLPRPLQLTELLIEQSTLECLTSAIGTGRLPDVLMDFGRYTLDELLQVPSFTVRCLVDLLVAVESASIQPAASSITSAVARTLIPLTPAEISEILNEPRCWRQYKQRGLPEIFAGSNLEDLRLSTRTYNCLHALFKEGPIKQVGDLSHMSLAQLLRQSGFGLDSMVDLLGAMMPRIHRSNAPLGATSTLSAELTGQLEKLCALRCAGRVRCNDIRLERELVPLLRVANEASDLPPLTSRATLADVAQRLVTRVREPIAPQDTLRIIRDFRRMFAKLMRLPLERELESIAAGFVSGRNLNVALRYLGWDGNPPTTLQAVGNDFHITRERVRQICEKLLKALQGRRFFMPRFDDAVRLASKRLPSLVTDVENRICTAGISRKRFSVESLIATSKNLGRPMPLMIDGIGSASLVVRQQDTSTTRLVMTETSRAVSKYGLTNIADVTERITERCPLEETIVASIVKGLPGYQDLGQNWFWLHSTARNHLVTIIRKIFAVAVRVHVGEVRAGIANDPRGMGFAPPKDVVLEFCRTALKCDIDGDFIESSDRHEPRELLSAAENIAFDVLRRHGPLLHRFDFERHCVAEGMNPITFSLYLKRSPIFAKYAPGIYGLTGTTFNPGDIERIRKWQGQGFSDHGWTENSEPWAAVEVTPAMLSTGVAGLPGGLRNILRGRYSIDTEDGEKVGNLVVSDRAVWGLGKFFRRCGGDPGDVLVLIFKPSLHSVTARVGAKASVLPDPVSYIQEIAPSPEHGSVTVT